MEEYLDVLNENGEFENHKALKQECHKNGFWHKAVVLFIINSKEQVLLQKRSEKKEMWPGMWDVSAGGHVLAGEIGTEAVIRETKEELGIDIDKKDLLFLGVSRSTNHKKGILNRHFNEYYIINTDIDEKKLCLNDTEVSEVKWVDKEEIIDRIKDNKRDLTDKAGCWDYLVYYYEWMNRNSVH